MFGWHISWFFPNYRVTSPCNYPTRKCHGCQGITTPILPAHEKNSTSKGSCSVLFKNKNCQTVVFGGSVHFLISFPLFFPSFWSSRIYSATGAHFFVAIGAGQVIVSLRHGIIVTCLHMRDRNQNLQAENWSCSVQHKFELFMIFFLTDLRNLHVLVGTKVLFFIPQWGLSL